MMARDKGSATDRVPRRPVTIAVDAMGGDRGPAAVIAGMDQSAAKNPDIRFTATKERAL